MSASGVCPGPHFDIDHERQTTASAVVFVYFPFPGRQAVCGSDYSTANEQFIN